MRLGISLGLVLVAGAGCAAGDRDPAVRVEPRTSLADEPVEIEVTGLPAEEVATLDLRSMDADGVTWTSSARFRTDGDGRIDVARTRPLSGRYTTPAASGLIWSLEPASRTAFSYRWPDAATKRMTFRLNVRVRGNAVAERTFRRRLSAKRLVRRSLPRPLRGFYVALETARDRPGVLLFGGSEGGEPSGVLATMLAARGYPSLGLAYWREPGLPPGLEDIPLEYFASALRWLGRQPEVDAERMVTLGGSRGSEAALLLGVHYPELVAGVVAAVPNSVSLCSYPGCTGPAWVLRGLPLPYTLEFDTRTPTDNPRAVIAVERIDGPVFAVCGALDRVWSSCGHAEAIMSRLERRGHRYPSEIHAYPDAGHGVGSLVPYMPTARSDVQYESDQRARADAWPHLLEFLDGLGQRD